MALYLRELLTDSKHYRSYNLSYSKMKYRYIKFTLTFFTLLLLFSCSDDGDGGSTPGLDTSVAYEERDVAYGDDPLQTYDVFLPANRSESDTHVIVLIHGGAWVSGDKADVQGIVDLLQPLMPNFAIINMNYRLTTKPNNPFVDQLEDVELALRELDIQSSNYNISDSYALAGVSAGGHMAMQHSYTKNIDNKIKVVGSIVGPTYFLDPAYTMATEPSFQILAAQIVGITGMPYTATAFYESISPLSAVNSQTPPTIQFHGTEDPLIPNSQGPLLKDRLDENNIVNELIIYEGEGHGWTDPDNWADTGLRFKNFVERFIDN